MSRNSYQYETSPRKYEPEYTPRRTQRQPVQKTKAPSKEQIRKNIAQAKAKRAEQRKGKTRQLVLVMAIFGMLLAVSYREISIMEMFNQQKEMENQLALIEKENGQIEKNIKEVESTLDWNKIKSVASTELGMQTKEAIVIGLEKTDNVEVEKKYIKEDKVSFLEKVVGFFINK